MMNLLLKIVFEVHTRVNCTENCVNVSRRFTLENYFEM